MFAQWKTRFGKAQNSSDDRSLRRYRFFFFGLTCALVAAAASTSWIISERQATLSRVSRYNVTWLTSQAPVELMRLQAALAALRLPGSGITEDDVELRLEIVRNRLDLFSNGEAAEFIRSRPDLEQTVADFRDAIGRTRLVLDQLTPEQSVVPTFKLLAPLVQRLVALAASANTQGGDLVTKDQAELGRLQYLLSMIITGLTVCGLVLLWLLTSHNELLKRAHGRVAALVQTLQINARNLEAANHRILESMDEAQRQNRVLEERDRDLANQITRFDAALNNMSQALCMVDSEQRLIVCNVRFLELWGMEPDKVRPGMLMPEVFATVIATGLYGERLATEIWRRQQKLIDGRISGSFFAEDGYKRAIAMSHQPMAGGGWVATYEDISERRRSEAKIHFMAHHDALTGLPNRILFKERLEAALQDAADKSEPAAVIYIDLDDFKGINDTLGHRTGDLLLEEVARRLKSTLKDSDTVARLGGDEFAVIAKSDRAQAEGLVKRLLAAVGRPFDVDSNRIIAGTSIGLAMIPDDGLAAEELLKCADMALYRAKADGRGTYRFFEPNMDVQVRMRRGIEQDLREALDSGALKVNYQPFLDLATNRVMGFEALLRWDHETRGQISPSLFIPIAEESGLITAIGEWSLMQACRDAATWPSDVKVAVNLSPRQFGSKNLISAVQRALDRSGLAPSRLELEITESALIKDCDSVLATMLKLRELGVGTSLDDFGTGYSSLSYLRSFPFDKIKIDQCFVAGMQSRPDCLAIVQFVSDLARRLGMATTAEGIETIEQLELVRAAGCTQAQGFYVDKARPASELSRWFGVDDATPGGARVAA